MAARRPLMALKPRARSQAPGWRVYGGNPPAKSTNAGR